MRHILASPYHHQTNEKSERHHRSIKGGWGLVPHEMPGELNQTIKSFVEYYSYRRYHKGLGDVTPHDVYTGRHTEIIHKGRSDLF